MPNVPNDFINTAPVEGAGSEQNIDVNPAAFGVGVGRALEETGAKAEEGAYRIIEKDNFIKVGLAREKFLSTIDAKSADLMTRQGINAAKAPEEMNATITQARQDALQGLTGRQQNMFELYTMRPARYALKGVELHAQRQQQVQVEATASMGMQSAIDRATVAQSDEERASSFNDLERNYNVLADTKGFTGQDRADGWMEKQSAFHTAIVRAY